MQSSTKVVEAMENAFQFLRDQATSREDGNTEALVDRMLRDIRQLQPEYRALTFRDMYGLANLDEKPGDGDKDGGFVPQSYEKTGAKDVNQKGYPPTGEDAGAPFVSKADVSVGEDGALVHDPNKKSNVTKTGDLDADNPEEKSTGTPKSGKVSKANA